jgi:predicted O-methyltransferase YrrM
LKDYIKAMLGRRFQTIPITARGVYRSLIYTLDDDPAITSERLVSLLSAAICNAQKNPLAATLGDRRRLPSYFDVWPGEHYRLLAGIVEEMEPRTIIEIGTFSGLSFLSLCAKASADCEITTFDILHWSDLPDTLLLPADFSDLRRQEIGDLAEPEFFKRHSDLFRRADLIFIDGPKNLVFENALMRHFEEIEFTSSPVMIFDDIKLWQMLAFWRDIRRPKLDATSLGHWTGTGMIDWRGR